MDKTFRFQQESLLRLREFEENRARRQLSVALKVARVLERELLQLVERREQAKAIACRDYTEQSAGGTSVLDVKELLRQQRYMNLLQGKLSAKQGEILQYRSTLEGAKAAFREACRRRKIVEKIKERRRREWSFRQERDEQRELDELGQLYTSLNKSSET